MIRFKQLFYENTEEQILNANTLEEAEEVISKDADYSYLYARDILEGRFEKGEEAISKAPYYFYNYANYILKDRFERGENILIDYEKTRLSMMSEDDDYYNYNLLAYLQFFYKKTGDKIGEF
jgi:hypothetical protein